MRVLGNQWYPLLESRELRAKPLGVERLGTRLVFWRSADKTPHAQLDRCPHLGAALSGGAVLDDQIVCPFHGFRYDGQGQCVHIPAVGSRGPIPANLAVQNFPVREAHGFLWVWWGKSAPSAQLPCFPELETGWRYGTTVADWPVHYTRAIENQLDVAHLPFVHRSTIGAGGRSLVEGPYVEASEKGIRVWVTNRRDDAAPRDLPELALAAKGKSPGLDFLFPGMWMLDLGPRLKNVIAFVPINEQTTRYYLRAYHRVSNRVLAKPFEWLMSVSNRFILNQDKRVVMTQTPVDSGDAQHDRLIGADRAINQFRKWHARLMEATNDY
jgi:phenylpropionate dioxygenase-like ring-hydroxylating dioxygenase large terminal subunit